MTAGLVVDGLGHRYAGAGPDVWALRDVGLTAAQGEVLAVVGPSGSGKTTLLRLLTGLLRPTAGAIRVGDRDVTDDPPERRPVAMVFQGFALFPHLSVRGNVAFGPRVRREPRAAVDARVSAAARALGIEPMLDRMPDQLSGGERQRVALARALVRDPVLFCLDEPLSSLDPRLRTDARRLLAPLLRESGRCAVYVTHDQAEAMTVGDRVAVLRDGRLEQVGTPREIYDNPATSFVASFVGTPPMSLVPAGFLPVDVPVGGSAGIRPEDVGVVAGEDATVVDVEDLGHELHVALDLRGATLVARLPESARPALGSRVGVVVDPARVRLFDAAGRAVSR